MNCTVEPWVALLPAGLTAIEVIVAVVAFVTVNMVAPVTAPILAEILLAPGATAVASPPDVTVATLGMDVPQVEIEETLLVEPSLQVAVAVNCKVVLCATVVLAGVTTMDLIVAAPPLTVNVVDPVTLPTAAAIVVDPAVSAVARPPELMLAIPVDDDVQAAVAVTLLVVPSLMLAVAAY